MSWWRRLLCLVGIHRSFTDMAVCRVCGKDLWKTELLACVRCGHEQVSVHPNCERIECAQCGFMNQSQPVRI